MQEATQNPEQSLDESHQSLIQFRGGDSTAVNRMIETVRPFLKQQVMEMIGEARGGRDDASDIVQKALMHAVQQIDTFQGQSLMQWRGWLCAIVKNKVIDTHRYWASEKRDSQRVVADSQVVQGLVANERSPSSIVMRDENAERLERAMSSLESSDRELIRMRQIEGLDHNQIAVRLGITEAASRQRLKAAMDRLRQAWKSLS